MTAIARTNFSASDLAEFGIGDAPVNGDGQHKTDDADLMPATITAGELCDSFKELKPFVIDELLRETETANLVSTSKAYKTFTGICLAICVCVGRMFLKRFAVSQGRVLYIDAELHRNTFAYRLAKVAKAMGVCLHEFSGMLDVLPLRGHLRDLMALDQYFREIPKGKYKLIVIDALYRLMPRGYDENSNADVTTLYNKVDQYAEMTGAAIVCVHHSTKGNQSGKDQTAIGSGAGAQSRAVDAHITLRQHKEDNAVVMEASLRSFAPLAPLVLRWTYPLWEIDPNLDPDDLREPGRQKRKSDEPEWTPESFAATFVTAQPKAKSSITVAAKKRGLNAHNAALLLSAAVDCGAAYQWKSEDRRAQYKFSSLPQPSTEGEKP